MSLIEIPQNKLDEIRNNKHSFLTPERGRNRIQCWASKYALNRCIEDMHEISKNLIPFTKQKAGGCFLRL